MNLEKATEVAGVIKHNLRKDLLAVEIRPMIEALEYFISLTKKINKAIEILGRPVMGYAPETMVEEYDEKIIQAVNYLTGKDKI